MKRKSLAIRVLFALCLAVGTTTHGRIAMQHGILWDYDGKVPLASRIFWTSLTFIDPLAAILLLFKPRAGLILTGLVIVTDVLHNTYYAAHFQRWLDPFYLCQIVFLLLVVSATPVAWRGALRQQRRETQH